MDERKPAPKLDDLLPPTGKQLAEMSESRYESSLVDTVCRKAGIRPEVRREIREWRKQQCGDDSLTFEGLHQVIPAFPFYFGVSLVRNLGKRVPVSKIFRNFSQTPLFSEFDKFWKNSEDVSVLHRALIFKWPNLAMPGDAATGLVIHRWNYPAEVSGVRLSFTVNQESNLSTKSKEPLVLYVEPLPVLLAELFKKGLWAT